MWINKSKYIVKNNLVEKIITNYNNDEPSEDFLKYNSKGQLIQKEDFLYKTLYTYNSEGNIETQNEISKLNKNYTNRNYVYFYDKYGNWTISLSLLDMSIAKGIPSFPQPTLRKITYSNGEVTGTTNINEVSNELIKLRKKIRNLKSGTGNLVMTWKKTSKTNFNFYFNNKTTAKITNSFKGNDLLVFDVDDHKLYLFENYVNAPLNKLKTAKKINIDTKNGYWFKLSNKGGVAVYTNLGEFIKKSSVYKYANNQSDVIFKGEKQKKQVVLKNYKNAKPLEVFPVYSYETYQETKITPNIISSGKCIKGDCENGYGEKESADGIFIEGFFEKGKPQGPIHTLNKEEKSSVFSIFNNSYRNLVGFKYSYDGKEISTFLNLSKNIGFYNNYTTKETFQLNINNGKITSKTKLSSNNDLKCVVGNCTNGTGIYEYSNSTYMGTFKNGKRDGVGTLFFKDGHQYIGEFYSDKYHGLGTYIWSDNNYYLGMYKDGKYNGKGVMYYNKTKYDAGIWQNGKFQGKVTTTSKNTNNNSISINTNSAGFNIFSSIQKNKILACNKDSECIAEYITSLSNEERKNLTEKDLIKKTTSYFHSLHTMNPNLAYKTLFKIHYSLIDIKLLPKEVRDDLKNRAKKLAEGYKKFKNEKGY